MKLLFFDLETTGTDVAKDRIVQIAICDIDGKGLATLVQPGIPIPKEASDIHHITDKDVDTAPPFGDLAPDIQAMLEGATLVGYNSKSFDARILDRHLREHGEDGIADDHPHIDLYTVWQEVERRTLANCARRYLGKDIENAHDARVDVAATMEILPAMLRAHDLDLMKAEKITRDSDITRWVHNKDGVWLWKFGKNRNKPVKDDISYVNWVLDKDFPPMLKRLLQEVILSA